MIAQKAPALMGPHPGSSAASKPGRQVAHENTLRKTVNSLMIVLILCCVACAGKNAGKQQRAASLSQTSANRMALQGIWWSPEMFQTAAFQIGDSTIYYPDAFAERPYELRNDSLFVYHEDGTIFRSTVVKVTADTLILSTFGREQIFTRAETQSR